MSNDKKLIKNILINMINRLFKFLPRLASYLMLVYVTLTLALCILTSWFFAPVNFAEFTSLNPLFIAIALILLLIIISIVTAIKKKDTIQAIIKSNKCFHLTVAVGAILIIIFQLFLINYIIYWQVLDIMDISFFQFAAIEAVPNLGNDLPDLNEYFQHYTDRWFLTGAFLQFYNFITSTGLHENFSSIFPNVASNGDPGIISFLLLQILSALCVTGSCVFAAYIARRLKGNLVGLLALFIAFMLAGISPMANAPYSDSFGMVFVTIALFSYVCINNKYVKSFLIVASSVVAYAIKPTCLAILAAICIVEICKFLSKPKIKENFKALINKKTLFACISIILAFAIFIPYTSYTSNYWNQRDNEKSFTYTHFLMMGSNRTTDGQYLRDDEAYSASFNTTAEREQANMDVFWERTSNGALFGNLKHWMKKSMTNYGCGNFLQPNSFAYGQPFSEKNAFLTSFYGVESEVQPAITDATTPHNCVVQVVWLLTLIGCITLFYKNKENKYISTIIIALGFVSLFLILAESSQRYLFIFVPCFAVLGPVGIQELYLSYSAFNNRRKLKHEKSN